MRRKGSRMSMDRFGSRSTDVPTPKKMEPPIPENPNFMQRHLEKSNSIQSSDSGSSLSKQNSMEKSGSIDKMIDTKLQQTIIHEEDSPGSHGSRKDEGLGESFDQQSEMSDTSSKPGNGAVNGTRSSAIYESVPEEDASISEQTAEGDTPELTLNPSKLPTSTYPDKIGHGNGKVQPAEGSPLPSKKLGGTKKVSFLWGNDEHGDYEGDKEPVSDTFIYEDKRRSKLSALKLKFTKTDP